MSRWSKAWIGARAAIDSHRCSSRSMARRKPMFSSTLAPRAKVQPNAAHSCRAISCEAG